LSSGYKAIFEKILFIANMPILSPCFLCRAWFAMFCPYQQIFTSGKTIAGTFTMRMEDFT